MRLHILEKLPHVGVRGYRADVELRMLLQQAQEFPSGIPRGSRNSNRQRHRFKSSARHARILPRLLPHLGVEELRSTGSTRQFRLGRLRSGERAVRGAETQSEGDALIPISDPGAPVVINQSDVFEKITGAQFDRCPNCRRESPANHSPD